MGLLDLIRAPAPAARAGAPDPAFVASRVSGTKTRAVSVSFSADLARVLALPKRDPAAYTAADVEELEARFRLTPKACRCREFGLPCPTRFREIQARALLDAPRAGGLLAEIGVGHGKTLLDLLLLKAMGLSTGVLIVPPNLIEQLLQRDWHYYGAHWRLPNLVGGQWFRAGEPALHVITYSRLSSPESSDLLERIKPDLIVCDEAHNLRDPKAARTIRFLRYFAKHPRTKLCALSGTLTGRSIKDYAHLARLALGEGSPLPLHHPTLEEWALALDPDEVRAAPGALERLREGGPADEDIRVAFRRRRDATPGVVATDASALGTSLVIRERKPGAVPAEIRGYIAKAHAGERPDGEQFVEALQIAACVRQLASGFFHRWRYPRGEPDEVILDWFAKRQAWNRELRERLKHPREHLDSPGLLTKAALRAYQDPPYDGDRPTWKAATFPAWHGVHDAVHPVPEAVWRSDFVIRDAAAWAAEAPGIVWVEFPELGEKIAKAAGVPWYGGGPEASEQIVAEKGDRSVVASIKAHATGKNLQRFSRNLVVTPPADGATWEQLLGRTHRPGQKADEVTCDVYLHTEDLRDGFAKARERALFIQQTGGTPQKLVFAAYVGAL